MKLLPLAALFLLACSATRDVRSDDSSASLELLKKLEGTWMKVDEQGRPTAEVASVFRVTAGGSAVEETVFPGGAEEMVTVYFVRDGVLQLTHYCMLGNQPHMVAEPRKSPDEIAFRCDGTGVDDEQSPHMHDARLRLGTDGRLSTRWQMHDEGKPTDLAEFTLARK